MQELTFETILRLPQMELKKTLKAELKSRGYPVTDKPGYLYAEGTIPVLLVAHMDTVHRQPVEQICYSADGAVAMSPQGIGGDDRCGVWMILQILRTANCHVLFCEDEEVGCVGAKKFTRGSVRPQVNYIVELDRRGSNDAVFYRCDNPEFEDFVTSFGFETANGSCSDISYIAPYLETAAVNISCGYYCEHQRHEYIHLEEMELNAARVAQMVTQQTEHFEYREQQDSFFGGRVYQYSMWDTAFECETVISDPLHMRFVVKYHSGDKYDGVDLYFLQGRSNYQMFFSLDGSKPYYNGMATVSPRFDNDVEALFNDMQGDERND